MARLPSPGGDNYKWGEILNEFLLVAHKTDGTLKIADIVASKYTKPAGGIPREDLHADVQNTLDSIVSSSAPDATTTTRGIVRLSGDLTGDALNPLVAPGRIIGGTNGHIQYGTITNANIHASAAIAKSKLAPLAITNDDIAVGAAIVQSKIQGLVEALAAKAGTEHTHSADHITSGLLNIARIPVGTGSAQVARGDHGHAIGDIANLSTTLSEKANTSDLANYATTTALTNGLAGKANTTDIDDLRDALDGKADASALASHDHDDRYSLLAHNHDSQYASVNHMHTIANVTGLSDELSDINTALDAKLEPNDLTHALGDYVSSTTLATTLEDYETSTELDARDASNRNRANHTGEQPMSTITGLTSTLANKLEASDLTSALGDYVETGDLTTHLAGKANTNHQHASTDISDFAAASVAALGNTILPSGTISVDYDADAGTITIGSTSGSNPGDPPSGDYVESVNERTGAITLQANDIRSGVFDVARVPDLDAGKITTGTFNVARLPVGTSDSQVAAGDHGHNMEAITGLAAALSAKVNTTDLTTTLANYVTSQDLTDHDHDSQYSPLGHTHAIADIPNLQSELSAKVNTTDLTTTLADYATTDALTNHNHDIDDVTGLATALAGKAAVDHTHDGVYAATGHTHTIANVTGLSDELEDISTALDAKLSEADLASSAALGTLLDGKANTSHTHEMSQVNGLATALGEKADTGHTHAASQVTSGTFAIARIPTGTDDTTVALGNHNHDSQYAALIHHHDDRYHTRSEVSALLNDKLNVSQASDFVTLDDEGKIPVGQLPALAVKDTFTVTSQAQMLGLTAQKGDMAIRTDLHPVQTFVLAGTGDDVDPTDSGNWLPLTSGATGVTDHGDLSGLGDDDHPQYHTQGRANTWLATKTADDIAPGTSNLYLTPAERTALETIDDLAAVATSGNYNDLADRPTIPAAQVSADWDATSGVAQILNKPVIGTAAAQPVGYFATAAQGALADTAVQPAAIANFETTTQLNTRDDANRNRANHTGEQPMSTVTGLDTALADKANQDHEHEMSEVNGLTSALNTKVGSTTVATLWTGTQTDYDAMPSHDPNTLYLITGA